MTQYEEATLAAAKALAEMPTSPFKAGQGMLLQTTASPFSEAVSSMSPDRKFELPNLPFSPGFFSTSSQFDDSPMNRFSMSQVGSPIPGMGFFESPSTMTEGAALDMNSNRNIEKTGYRQRLFTNEDRSYLSPDESSRESQLVGTSGARRAIRISNHTIQEQTQDGTSSSEQYQADQSTALMQEIARRQEQLEQLEQLRQGSPQQQTSALLQVLQQQQHHQQQQLQLRKQQQQQRQHPATQLKEPQTSKNLANRTNNQGTGLLTLAAASADASRSRSGNFISSSSSSVSSSGSLHHQRGQWPPPSPESPVHRSPQNREQHSALVSPPSLTHPTSGTGQDPPAKVVCNCKRSRCLKLYCDCFAQRQYCSGCNCVNCSNTLDCKEERELAIQAALDRNPQAFQPKIVPSPGRNGVGHLKGCNCKKSSCLKRYCECFLGEVYCGSNCKCVVCKNHEGSSALLKIRGKLNRTPSWKDPRTNTGASLGTSSLSQSGSKAFSPSLPRTPPVVTSSAGVALTPVRDRTGVALSPRPKRAAPTSNEREKTIGGSATKRRRPGSSLPLKKLPLKTSLASALATPSEVRPGASLPSRPPHPGLHGNRLA